MMKALLLGAGICFALGSSAQVVAIQNFDGGTPEWSYTLNPADGTFTSSTDVWGPVTSLPSTSVGSGVFLGARDIENGDNPNGDFATATFASVSVDPTLDHQVSFDYDITGYDTGDLVEYQLVVDGVADPLQPLLVGGVGGLSAAGTFAVSVPAGATTIGLILRVEQNGGTDYAGFDNFTLEATVPLPITLTAFTATPVVMGAQLNWDVATQRNNDFFGVEMSRDGLDFTEVARVQGDGTLETATSYSHTFTTDDAGMFYFRLRQVDFDGTTTYSDVVLAELDARISERLDVRAAGLAGYVQITTPTPGEVAVISMTGEVIARYDLQGSTTTLNVSGLPKGIYLITDGETSRRFVR